MIALGAAGVLCRRGAPFMFSRQTFEDVLILSFWSSVSFRSRRALCMWL